ncbi:MAG: transcriptional regulator [Steroidobacteraceae bacterium]
MVSSVTDLHKVLSEMEVAKLLDISKGYEHNRPQTLCRITAQGRKRYLEYLAKADPDDKVTRGLARS